MSNVVLNAFNKNNQRVFNILRSSSKYLACGYVLELCIAPLITVGMSKSNSCPELSTRVASTTRLVSKSTSNFKNVNKERRVKFSPLQINQFTETPWNTIPSPIDVFVMRHGNDTQNDVDTMHNIHDSLPPVKIDKQEQLLLANFTQNGDTIVITGPEKRNIETAFCAKYGYYISNVAMDVLSNLIKSSNAISEASFLLKMENPNPHDIQNLVLKLYNLAQMLLSDHVATQHSITLTWPQLLSNMDNNLFPILQNLTEHQSTIFSMIKSFIENFKELLHSAASRSTHFDNPISNQLILSDLDQFMSIKKLIDLLKNNQHLDQYVQSLLDCFSFFDFDNKNDIDLKVLSTQIIIAPQLYEQKLGIECPANASKNSVMKTEDFKKIQRDCIFKTNNGESRKQAANRFIKFLNRFISTIDSKYRILLISNTAIMNSFLMEIIPNTKPKLFPHLNGFLLRINSNTKELAILRENASNEASSAPLVISPDKLKSILNKNNCKNE